MYPLLRRFAGRIDRLSVLVGTTASWLCLAMVLVGAYNALARHAGKVLGVNLSSNAFIEAQWYMFSVLFLLGAAHTLKENEHVRVDVIYGRLSARAKAWIDLIGTLVLLLPFCAFMIWTSIPAVTNSWAVRETSPDPGGLIRYPLKTVLPVAFGLLFLQGLSFGIKALGVILGHERGEPPGTGAPPEVHESSEGGEVPGPGAAPTREEEAAERA